MTHKSHATHLLEFSVENYRSIREPVVLSLFSTRLHDHKHDFAIATSKHKVLNSVVLYGANASGKSNVLRALFVYRHAVVGNNNLFARERVDPFLLDESSKTKDTKFEACFEYNNRMFVYGFQLSTKTARITREWLKASRANSASLLSIYERMQDNIEVTKSLPLNQHGISRSFTRQVQPQELFLTTISKNSAWSLAKDVVTAWNNCTIFNTLEHDPLAKVAGLIFNEPSVKNIVLPLLQQADLGITDIDVKKNEADQFTIRLQHTYTTKNSIKNVWFDIANQESAGTIKFFSFALPLLYTLQTGALMVLDELGSTLHPDLLRFVVTLFSDRKYNKHNAQLILTTHDTSLLKDGLLARDQLYFTRKNVGQVTELYSLSDIKGVRKSVKNLDERYLSGDFGATPTIILE